MIKTGLKQGFTLAEVLTTLMVIGVVAAMTIPTLLNSTDDQQHKVALKKAVSVLSQAYQLNIAKEFEHSITNSLSLCTFFANSMAGSCQDAGNNAAKMTTPDGIQYYFFLRGAGADTTFESTCGDETLAQAGADAPDAWAGEDANCVVIVDTNGGKGNQSVGALTTSMGSNKADQVIEDDAFKERDQFPLIIKARGIYPALAKDVNGANASRGYRYVYGDSALSPWGSQLNKSGQK